MGELDADLSDASIMRLTVLEDISINASGASILYYKANPTISLANLSGASQLIDSN